MDLLSPADRLKIRAAIHDVTDTFCKEPIPYYAVKEKLDIYNEDRKKSTEYAIAYNLMALVEFIEVLGTANNATIQMVSGTEDMSSIKVTLNLEDLIEMGAVDDVDNNYQHHFIVGNDYFIIKGVEYKLTGIGYDGPLDAKPLLLIMFGTIRDNK